MRRGTPTHAARARRFAVAVGVSVVSIGLAACDSGGAATPSTPPTTAPTPTSEPPDDGVLRLGVLAPTTGEGARIGQSVRATVQFAVDEINRDGGVLGAPVELVAADEGADVAAASVGVDKLLKAGVDAVVGPASSTDALSLLDALRRNHVVSCSATATALSLDRYPDDGLFFRTAPSDSLEAEAIARAIDQTGRSAVGLLYVDDPYGRPFAAAVRDALARRSITVDADAAYDPTASAGALAEIAREVASAPVIAVIGAADVGAHAVAAVLEASPGADAPVIVNDAMRGTSAADVFAGLSDDDRHRIIGVGPRATTESTEFLAALTAAAPGTSGLFATNAFDCVNLIALAAAASRSTEGPTIAANIPAVATSGSRCTDFGSCLEDLEAGRNIDYDGPSGALQLSVRGDPNRGIYDVFAFTADGDEITTNAIAVS